MVKAKPLSHYFLWIAFILAACEGSRESAKTNALERYCIDSSLVILVKGINAISVDSVIVDLEVKNQCTDSVIIMLDYTKPLFYFSDESVHHSSVQITQLYPSIDWAKSSKATKEIYLSNRCNPLISNYNIIVNPPDKSKVITYDLKDLGYYGFTQNVTYEFFVSFDVSNQIKSYCPFVWSGLSKSSLHNFVIR